MYRDVTKVLSEADTLKLRALLAAQPEIADSGLGAEYPKMLYAADYWPLYVAVKTNPDPLKKKEAQQAMQHVIIVVHDLEVEEDYLADGWRDDPVKHLIEAGEADPRTPHGREGRRAVASAKIQREEELRDLKRRYAELTGIRLKDAEEADAPNPGTGMGETQSAAAQVQTRRNRTEPATAPTGKREKVAAAAKRSTGGQSATA